MRITHTPGRKLLELTGHSRSCYTVLLKSLELAGSSSALSGVQVSHYLSARYFMNFFLNGGNHA